jgi:hypothetical protein
MRNVSDKSCRKNENTHFVFNNFFRESFRLLDNVEKYGRTRQAPGDNTMLRGKDAIFKPDNQRKNGDTDNM